MFPTVKGRKIKIAIIGCGRISKNHFGLFESNENLKDRIGDYILIFKKNYYMRDKLKGEGKRIPKLGYHGGLSKEEMLVPLILIDC